MQLKNGPKKNSKEARLFIGLDAAVVVGNPDVITTALIIIPLTIAMALVLPGNRVLPFADLAVVLFPCSDGGCLDSREFVEKHRDRFSHYCFIAMVWFCNIPNVDSNC
ncbi:MAG: PTS transporter subunit IIC [Veillonella parvula]